MARTTTLPANVARVSPLPVVPLLYRLLRDPLRRVLERLFDFRVEGLEHLPSAGPVLVAANHHNYLDGVVLAAAATRPIAFLVMPRVWRATPLHPMLHRHIGSIPLNLSRPDVGALRRAIGALGDGHAVGIFPEGPFSVRGRLEAGLPGVGLLALRSGAPVVPVGIRGTYAALVGRRGYVPRRHPLAVRFGAPRRFARADGRAARLATTQRIMDDIAALLC
ncbi:MAG: 1-acyl-sn-glycerol-3-phosphate acyltransferase [Candidatus Rokubacteria bacterium]|nr:1-acyl-sn-glycerol-3-phosphate acyltransferase [Candidatus Rokubacteria bacterium]